MSDKYLPNIGALASDTAQRDAIHIAVAPVIAGEQLRPGQRIAFEAGSAERVRAYGTSIGIVDPFLDGPVQPGQRFWMFLLPNTITSLRHEWTHPAFVIAPAQPTDDPVAASSKWLHDMAVACDQTYSRLMSAAQRWVEDGDYTYDNSETYKDALWGKEAEFWKHYEIVTGTKVDDHEGSFFTCSC